MDFMRAQEIIQSPQSITVFHNGKSIWIERLNATTQTAVIRTTSEQMTVPVAELHEVH